MIVKKSPKQASKKHCKILPQKCDIYTIQYSWVAKIHLGCRRLADSELIFETGKSVYFWDEWHKRPTKGHSWWKEKNMALDIVTAVYHNGVRKVLEVNLGFKNYDTPKFSWDTWYNDHK